MTASLIYLAGARHMTSTVVMPPCIHMEPQAWPLTQRRQALGAVLDAAGAAPPSWGWAGEAVAGAMGALGATQRQSMAPPSSHCEQLLRWA